MRLREGCILSSCGLRKCQSGSRRGPDENDKPQEKVLRRPSGEGDMTLSRTKSRDARAGRLQHLPENPGPVLHPLPPQSGFRWWALARPRAVWRRTRSCWSICPWIRGWALCWSNISIRTTPARSRSFYPGYCPSRARNHSQPARRAQPRLYHSAQHRRGHRGRRVETSEAPRIKGGASLDRFLFRNTGAGPAQAGDRRHPFRHGYGRHAGTGGDQGRGRDYFRAG